MPEPAQSAPEGEETARRVRHRMTPAARLLDAAVILCVAAGLFWLAGRVGARLHYRWNWAAIPQFLAYADASGHWRAGRLSLGFFATIRLSLWAGALALCIGTLAGLARLSQRPYWRLWGGAYVIAVRNTPPLVLIFLFNYFLTAQLVAALGLDTLMPRLAALTPPVLRAPAEALFGPAGQAPAFATAVLTLALIEGAYVAEIVRAGVRSVENGQWDAAHALGFGRLGALRHVVLPQAFRRMVPTLTGQFVSTLKDSAIVSVISIPELTFQAQELVSATYRAFEVWTLVFLMYLALGLPCSLAARRLEKRLARADRHPVH